MLLRLAGARLAWGFTPAGPQAGLALHGMGVGLCSVLPAAQVELWCLYPVLLGLILTCSSSWVSPSPLGPQGPPPQLPLMTPLRGSRCQVFGSHACYD